MLSKKDLGNLVKKARQIKSQNIGKRYSQPMLAYDINKSQSYIGDIETGRIYPSFAALGQIAEACNVPISYFQDEDTNKHNYISLDTPKDAIKFLLNQSTIIDFLEIDMSKLSHEDLSDFTDELLHQLKLISYKYKK